MIEILMLLNVVFVLKRCRTTQTGNYIFALAAEIARRNRAEPNPSGSLTGNVYLPKTTDNMASVLIIFNILT